MTNALLVYWNCRTREREWLKQIRFPNLGSVGCTSYLNAVLLLWTDQNANTCDGFELYSCTINNYQVYQTYYCFHYHSSIEHTIPLQSQRYDRIPTVLPVVAAHAAAARLSGWTLRCSRNFAWCPLMAMTAGVSSLCLLFCVWLGSWQTRQSSLYYFASISVHFFLIRFTAPVMRAFYSVFVTDMFLEYVCVCVRPIQKCASSECLYG